ncbi:MAG TPA: tetraacyldisaccharide 4'-kinase [Chitinophagaceae bacterium]|nr:tetraacyldisaccharide 4'-kinase [Chitinophagaceae bacterium]
MSVLSKNVGRFFKLLLYPLSLLYGLITWLRNRFYDKGILSEIEFDIPTIAVGNLSVGGTGKTPHVEYLIHLLMYEFYVATLSRGYNRKTKGYLYADENATALTIGDEPKQFLQKFPDISVSVGEERALALPQLLQDAPETEVVILDDAFQHRSIKPGINIMVTEYNRLFTRDHIVPFGRLRESRAGYKRADCIIVSKCPADLTTEKKQKIINEIRPLPHQKIFFSAIRYGRVYHFLTNETETLLPDTGVVVACGIANPTPLVERLKSRVNEIKLLRFPDHHFYTENELYQMEDAIAQLKSKYKIILTTEKDAARLDLFRKQIEKIQLPLFVVSLNIYFLFNENPYFDQYIMDYMSDAMAQQFTT